MPSSAPPSRSVPVSMPLPTHTAEATVSAPTFSPLYLQIRQALLDSLQSGEWKPLQAIPSEMELARRYQVSQGTVRKAIDELVADNLLVRRQGKGTFVASHNERHVEYRFLRLQPDTGSVQAEGPAQRHIVCCRRTQPTAALRHTLQLGDTGKVLHVRRVLSLAGTPTILEDMWLPLHLFAGLKATDMANYPGSTYALFEEKYAVRMIRASEQVRAVLASATQAQALGITQPAALLQVDRVTYTYNDQPVEVRHAFYRTDTHHYQNTLS